ncbi:nucleolar protein 3-like [Argiope bruennichi]|uniref:Uncharacterized protein n=1 Tax=Argiope bruennichi TaxID=94029 RepID=A0A8T0G1A6_ARGBR|nr:nucleolar protein 3-like [Argiope bruennichi]KAF8794953.1 hypothetical protein HNY73_002861 [Argiope bruennichi]
MKLLVFVAVFAIFLAFSEAKRCRSGEDCKEDECCIVKGFIFLRRGECQKLAQKGERCSEEEDTEGFLDQKYRNHCPCAGGLSCEPTEVKDLPFGITLKYDERCVGDVTVPTPTEPEPEPETEEPKTEEPEPEPETEEPEPEPETEEPEPEPEDPEPEQ